MSDDHCTLDSMSISKMKVNDLRKELKSRGLNSTGNKTELMDRLMEAVRGSKTDDTSADGSVDELIDEDDVLNDEEIDDEVSDYKHLELEVSDKSFEIESTPNANKSMKRRSSELDKNNSTDNTTKPAKKITLNRHLSSEDEFKSAPVTNDGNNKTDEKRVIKLSELSAKDRLEMRAKKFGTSVPDDAKKIVRAERFGRASTKATVPGRNTITLNNTGSSIDTLKKRAERFGSTVSTQLSQAEKVEKLEQRKARFGVTSSVNGATDDMQKAKRLERFKTSLK